MPQATNAVLSVLVTGVLLTACGSPSASNSESASAGNPTPSSATSEAREPSPAPTPIAADVAGPSRETLEAVCPFVFTFLQDYPDVPRYGITLSVAGQPTATALNHAMEVGRISTRINASSKDPFTQQWLELGAALSSPEYQAGAGVTNDGAATQALVAMNKERVARLQTSDDANGSKVKALKQAAKACKNWPNLQLGVTKFTYMEPKNVKQREDALKAAKNAAKLDPEWNSLVGALTLFNENFGPHYETDGWTKIDDAVVSASVKLDKECATITALSR